MAWIATALSVCKMCYIVILSVHDCVHHKPIVKKRQMMRKITQALGHMIDPLISYYLRRTGKVFLIFVGLCVCLPVSNITEKCVNGVPWNLQGKWNLVQGIIWNVFGMFCLTPWTQESFSTFSWKSVSVSNITVKWVTGFSWNFKQRLQLRQGTICNIFGMLQLTHWIQDRFFYFLYLWLLVISRNISERIFMKFSWNVGDTKNS